MAVSQSVVGRANAEKPHGLVGMLKNPYVFMTCAFASLGCIMYGYDQGVMSPVLVMENFENHFPYLMGSTIQGWLVSALELGAWAGALFNGYLADRISRKYSMMVAVVIFTLGSGLQAGAQTPAYFFAGRIIGGVGIGMFSHVCLFLLGNILYSLTVWPSLGYSSLSSRDCSSRTERVARITAATLHHYRNIHCFLAGLWYIYPSIAALLSCLTIYD